MKISDETVIITLLTCGSIRGAAAELGTSPQTIQKRLNKDSFRLQYEQAKSEMLCGAVESMKSRLTEAINTLSEVMQNEDNPATVRVSAADSLLRHAVRYIETAEFENRLRRLEEAEEAQREK